MIAQSRRSFSLRNGIQDIFGAGLVRRRQDWGSQLHTIQHDARLHLPGTPHQPHHRRASPTPPRCTPSRNSSSNESPHRNNSLARSLISGIKCSASGQLTARRSGRKDLATADEFGGRIAVTCLPFHACQRYLVSTDSHSYRRSRAIRTLSSYGGYKGPLH